MATITSPRATSPAPIITSPSLASLNSPTNSGTPTSSLRPSLDVSRPSDAPSHPQQSQRRNRAALRDYYNLKSRPATAQPGRKSSIASTASDATTNTTTTVNAGGAEDNDTSPLLTRLDGADFDAEAFIKSLLESSSLRDILKTESALVSEIRTLDGERKALVYDNYSKLIRAVGTLGEMQRGMRRDQNGVSGLDGVEVVRGKMDALEETVKTMGVDGHEGGATDLGAGGGAKERRRKKEQKERVRWVLEAPRRLEGMGKAEANDEFQQVRKALDAWEGVTGVEELRHACERVMAAKRGPEEEDEEGGDGKT